MRGFTRIKFFIDEHGKCLDEPRILLARQMNASEFYITDADSHYGLKQIQIRRVIRKGRAKQDRWNDDGSPPTVVLSIYQPTLSFNEVFTEIWGFESACLVIAGLMMEPYESCSPRCIKRPVTELIRSTRPLFIGPKLVNVRPQKIELS